MRQLSSLILLLFLFSCSSEFHEYKTTPDYINNASGIKKSYYDAYDNTLKTWNVSYEELYIPTTYGIAHVIVTGSKSAEPIVLFHGMNASSTMWYPNIKALSKKHRVYAIDFVLETGKSYLRKDFENSEKVNDWYKEVLFVLELDSFHLIGASRGGWLATDFAVKNPNRIKSLILLSPVQTFTWIKPNKDLLKMAASSLTSKENKVAQTLESMSSNSKNISEEYIKQYKIATEMGGSNKFMASMKPFSNKDLKSLKMPVLVLIGDKDIFNDEKSLKAAKKLPNAKGEIVQNAGHFLSVDQPKVVNGKMVNFLKENKQK